MNVQNNSQIKRVLFNPQIFSFAVELTLTSVKFRVRSGLPKLMAWIFRTVMMIPLMLHLTHQIMLFSWDSFIFDVFKKNTGFVLGPPPKVNTRSRTGGREG